jgi:flavin reductase (DIM6/NTAB) family NADH-FMN oxidoreductase RutF
MLSGEPYHVGSAGTPILEDAPAYLECRLVEMLSKGDHSLFLGEVVEAGLQQEIKGRPDEATLWLKDLGERIFYGG